MTSTITAATPPTTDPVLAAYYAGSGGAVDLAGDAEEAARDLADRLRELASANPEIAGLAEAVRDANAAHAAALATVTAARTDALAAIAATLTATTVFPADGGAPVAYSDVAYDEVDRNGSLHLSSSGDRGRYTVWGAGAWARIEIPADPTAPEDASAA